MAFPNEFWIILVGILVAISSSLLGCFLVLRKSAMIGDAISHAVLPGIFFAFLLSGSRASFPALLGAAFFGVLCTFLIEWLSRKGRMQNDAAIGVIFTFLFAVGVILISGFSGSVDLDTECVLYGEITLIPFETWTTNSGLNLGPVAVWQLLSVNLAVVLFIVLGYKGLQLTTFDSAYAATLGVSTALWHYLLMGMVALTTVVSFEAVGAILVVAFLVTPAATAYLLTYNLKTMLILAALIGSLSSILGYYLAAWIDGAIAAAMAVVGGFLFVLALLFSPSQGLLTRRFRQKLSLVETSNTENSL